MSRKQELSDYVETKVTRKAPRNADFIYSDPMYGRPAAYITFNGIKELNLGPFNSHLYHKKVICGSKKTHPSLRGVSISGIPIIYEDDKPGWTRWAEENWGRERK
jgi:hypothetical protein